MILFIYLFIKPLKNKKKMKMKIYTNYDTETYHETKKQFYILYILNI